MSTFQNLFSNPQIMDFIHDDEEQESLEQPEILTEKQEVQEESEIVLNEYEEKLQSLFEEGILNIELPQEYKGKDLGPTEAIYLLETALRNKIEEPKAEEVLSSMSDFTRRVYEFEQLNNDPNEVKDFLRGLVFEQDIKSLDPETEPEKVLTEYYRSIGSSKEEIDELISEAKELGKLVQKAQAVKPKLETKVAEIANARLEEEKKIKDLEISALRQVNEKLDNVLKDRNLSEEQKTFLKGVLVEDEIEVPYGKGKIKLSGAEYLIRFHKFSSKGNLPHLVDTLLYLQFPEEFNKQVVKKVEQKETARFIKENKLSGAIKTGSSLIEKEKIKNRGMDLKLE